MRPSAILGLLLLVSPLASAQDASTPVTLTLEQAIERGTASSHRLDEAGARRDQVAAGVEQRRAVTRPQVAAQGGYTRTNHVDEFGVPTPTGQLRVIYPDVPDNVRTRLDVQWPIYSGGRFEALVAASQFEADAAADDREAVKADVTLDITRAYWSLVTADESARVVAESLTRMTAHLRDVRNQLGAGLIPPNEVLTVEAQEARQRMLSIQADVAREVAEADLARLVGVPPGRRIQPTVALDPVVETRSAETLVALALQQRRDRQALLDRLKATESRQDAAVAGRKPTIAVNGGVDYANPNPRIFPREAAWKESWDASINVSWPIFDGGRTKADTAEATAARRALQARLDELDSMVALEVRQRLAEITSSRAAVTAAEAAVRAATEARRVVGDRFAAGVATSTDLLDAQVVVLQASLDRTQAIAAGKLAEARLRRVIGQ